MDWPVHVLANPTAEELRQAEGAEGEVAETSVQTNKGGSKKAIRPKGRNARRRKNPAPKGSGE